MSSTHPFRSLAALALCALISLGACLAAFAQQDKAPDAPPIGIGSDVDEATKQRVMEHMMAIMAPGPEHQRLHDMAGEWRQVVTMTMDPAAPETQLEARGENEIVLGGRFLMMRATGDFMGQPFESLTMLGFDRRYDHYTLVGYDTLGTYYVTAEGVWDEASQSIRFRGETSDPKANTTEKYTMVYKPVNPNEYIWEVWFDMPDGKQMRIVHVRNVRGG